MVGALPKTAKTDWNGWFHQPIIREPFYNAAVQDDGIFNMEMIEKPQDEYAFPKSHFYAIDLKQGKRLLSYEEDPFFFKDREGEYQYEPDFMETVMKYKNNHLYVLRSYRKQIPTDVTYEITSSQNGDTISIVDNTSLRNNVHISIFDNNRSIYEGELVSAAQEDDTYQGYGTYQAFGVPYTRRYYFLELE
jgi:hypothetical protein